LNMQHIIKKQVIELELDRSLDSFRTQESVSRRFWNSVVPMLLKTFDEATAHNEVLTVDRLVIDIGVLTEKSLLKDDWIIELSHRLEKQITGLKMGVPNGSGVESSSLPLGIFRQWLFYIQNGYLHWNTLKADDKWYSQVLGAMAGNPEYAQELLTLARNDSSALNRLVAQHSDAFLLDVVQILTRQDQSGLKTVFEVLHNLSEKQSPVAGIGTDTLRELRKTLWIKILTGNAKGTDSSASFAGSGVSEFLKSRNLPANVLETLDTVFPGSATLSGITIRKLPGDSGKQSEPISKKEKLPGLPEEGIFAVNAGLVLLHPFLNNYFKRLKLVKDNAFVDKKIWQKALYLLHYLATGSTEAAEHELVIPRMLCAYPGEETVERGIPVSPAETEEADNMLTAVISQWEILKNTSMEGLREGFLQRSGKLFVKEENIYLQVETSGIDVLLDRLPWSLSTIKLPWMEKIVRVEWR
jgi:hypothetical protein